MASVKDGDLIFSTGRRLESRYIHWGIIGINASLQLGGGCDILLDLTQDGPLEGLTAEERRELADYMVGLWQQFAAKEAAS